MAKDKVFSIAQSGSSGDFKSLVKQSGQNHVLGCKDNVQIVHQPDTSSVSLKGRALCVHRLIHKKLLAFNQAIWTECWSPERNHCNLDYMLIMTNNLNDAAESITKGSAPKDEICVEGLEEYPWVTCN